MKQTCQQCHFLCKQLRIGGGGGIMLGSLQPWNATDREECDPTTDRESFVVSCYRQIWQNIDCRDKWELKKEISTNRKGGCFFIPFGSGMPLEAAEQLEKRTSENRRFERTRTIAWTAIGVSLLGVLLSIYFRFLPHNPTSG